MCSDIMFDGGKFLYFPVKRPFAGIVREPAAPYITHVNETMQCYAFQKVLLLYFNCSPFSVFTFFRLNDEYTTLNEDAVLIIPLMKNSFPTGDL